MDFRPAQVADVDAMLPMIEQTSRFHAQLDPARFATRDGFLPGYGRWVRGLIGSGRSAVFVAEHESKVVGFIIATIEQGIPIYVVHEFGYVHELWIKPTYRNEGVARQLVTLVIERFAELKVSQIRLEIAAGNDAALGLFESAGFRLTTREMLMELPGGVIGSCS
ncbi:MAG: N-acetyltransferase [Tepidisphaeraceae bacterium]